MTNTRGSINDRDTAAFNAWSPADYQHFAAERLRPAQDLIGRMFLSAPGVIADLGCGPGTVTRLLAEKWPHARIIGLDNDLAMLSAASAANPALEWRQEDIGSWRPDTVLDIVFSNAALHWLDDHHHLFPRLAGFIRPGGLLAVQMPRSFDEPIHQAIRETVAAPEWSRRLRGLVRVQPVLPPQDYIHILSECTQRIDVWDTTYHHMLSGENPVAEWAKGAALRPFLARLSDRDQLRFFEDFEARVARAYPQSQNGSTIFPFRRVFIIAEC